MSDAAAPFSGGLSIVSELGMSLEIAGDAISGRAAVQEHACVPGTDLVRTSVLATWADVVTGVIAGHAISPRIPLTLDLEVQVQQQAVAGTRIVAEAVPTKVGRTILVSEARFRDADTGAPIAAAIGSFIASPNPDHVFEGGFPPLARISRTSGLLAEPFARRAACTVVEPGTAEVPHQPGNLNSSGAIQGGILALVAEEAAASLQSGPTVLASMSLRYMRPFPVGPARAVAEGGNGMALVRITDTGTAKLGAIVTTRSF